MSQSGVFTLQVNDYYHGVVCCLRRSSVGATTDAAGDLLPCGSCSAGADTQSLRWLLAKWRRRALQEHPAR